MKSISGQIIGDTFHMKIKDVSITGRITDNEIISGLIKLNENISTPQESDIENLITGIDLVLFSDEEYTTIGDFIERLGTHISHINGIVHENNTYLKYPFEEYTQQ